MVRITSAAATARGRQAALDSKWFFFLSRHGRHLLVWGGFCLLVVNALVVKSCWTQTQNNNAIDKPLVVTKRSEATPGTPSNPRRPTIVWSHEPTNDLLGSFLTPSVYLLGVVEYYRAVGWDMATQPYMGSKQQLVLSKNFAKGHKIEKGWGTGFVDANFRTGYDPVSLNAHAHETMGGMFAPTFDTTNVHQTLRYPD
ncbi:MAG: hypothetical protein SGARI_007750, partial [Bacillariaceae sp.]